MEKRKRKLIRNAPKLNIKVKAGDIDYKNVAVLSRFVSSRYKILPRQRTNVSSKVQRKVTREIKKARFLGLLPYTERHAA